MNDISGLFNAKQAKELAGPTVEEKVLAKVESILVSVKTLAGQGKRQLRAGYDHHADTDLWVNGGYSSTDEWKMAKGILEKLGYKVSFFYEERQFVDMYTIIEW